jgi:hypothetical protein
MSLIKTKLRSRLRDENLHAILRISSSVGIKPEFVKLVKNKQCQVSSASQSEFDMLG